MYGDNYINFNFDKHLKNIALMYQKCDNKHYNNDNNKKIMNENLLDLLTY